MSYEPNSYVRYAYDAAGQLTWAKATNSSGQRITTEAMTFGFDPAWNMAKRTNDAAVTTYTVNSLNQVTGDGTYTWTYDGNGNRTQRNNNTYYFVYYVYDDENQLIEARTDSNGYGTPAANRWKTQFKYDGRQRVEYNWNTYGGGQWVAQDTVSYVYDGMRILEERSTANGRISYTRGNDLSGTLEGAGGIGGLLARSVNGGSHAFYHADGNGNITAMVNASQTVVANYRYDPWGRTISSSGTLAGANLMRFSSKPVHTPSGFYYYGYRFYDPQTQRWVNRDPLGDPASILYDGIPRANLVGPGEQLLGVNLYTFVRNAVVNLVDLLGLSPEDVRKVHDAFNGSVDRMNKQGERCKCPPLNNLLWYFCPRIKACADQEETVRNDLKANKYDDVWTFQPQVNASCTHQWGMAVSKNPYDPIIVYDPWKDSIIDIPPPWFTPPNVRRNKPPIMPR